MTIKKMRKTISFLLALVLVLALVPAAIAPKAEAKGETRTFTTLEEKNSNIAPGVTETIKTVRKTRNKQQLVYYAMTVDLNQKDNVKIEANYKDNTYTKGEYGLQKTTEQMAAAEKNHAGEYYTPVGGINVDTYDMSTGQPHGAFAMDGNVYQDATTGYPHFFAILKDGTAKIGWSVAEWNQLKNDGQILEAVGGWHDLVHEGRNVASDWGGANPDPNARTAIGMKANGEVVLLVADGKQAPISEGADMTELASILIEMGCTEAFNVDGGGSTTYISRPEGESTYRVVNKPCDGSERAVSTSLMVVSTVKPSDTFERASITANANYITPGGTVNLTATGISPAGTPVDIPADVKWSYTGELGELTGNGNTAVFKSTGTEGTATIQILQNEKVVGSTTINVVKPNVFSFDYNTYAVPYGKAIDLTVTARYKFEGVDSEESEYEVMLHDGDVEYSFELSADNVATLTGAHLSARAMQDGDPNTISGTVSAKLTCNNLSCEAPLSVGRESEVVFDFEGKDYIEKHGLTIGIDGAGNDKNIGCKTTIEIVDRDHGMVHDGDWALKVTIDYSDFDNTYSGAVKSWYKEDITQVNVTGTEIIDLEGAQSIGMWVWVPEENRNSAVMLMYRAANGGKYAWAHNDNSSECPVHDEGHWVYASIDVSTLTDVKVQNPISFYYWSEKSTENFNMNMSNKFVFYVDSWTVDYSTVHQDRDIPEVKSVAAVTEGDSTATMERGTAYNFGTKNNVSFVAEVSDPVNSNSTGIDEENIRAYIDGKEIGTRYVGGKVYTNEAIVPDGEHTLSIHVQDKAENYVNVQRTFEVSAGNNAPRVYFEAKDPTADRILIGSLYYANLMASDISKIDTVSMDLDLNNISIWELDHADVNEKFKLEYNFNSSAIAVDENIATVTLTRIAPWKEGDSNVMATLPIRTWGTKYTKSLTNAWQGFAPVDVSFKVERGEFTLTDGETEYMNVFGGGLQVDTELFNFPPEVQKAYPDKQHWHVHDTNLKTLETVEATCTTDGYENRTFCETCQSIVDWGETLVATGHNYELAAGVLKCTSCDELYNGVWEKDNKLYKDGKVVAGWQEDNTYYVDGVKLGEGLHRTTDVVKDETGEKTLTRIHKFGADGVCVDKASGYSGYYTENEKGDVLTAVDKLPENAADLETYKYYYIEGGLPYTGWLYFNKDGNKTDPDKTKPEGSDTDAPGDTTPDKDKQQAIQDLVAYHVHTDGRVHSVKVEDTRKCVVSGYLKYYCNACDEMQQSELLWFNGHNWQIDEDGKHTCTKCGYVGRDISKAILNIAGELFDYTESEIRAAHIVSDNGQWLSVRSDKNGLDGYSTYADNIEIGTATLTIEGVGNYYGTLSGTFKIVPQSVKTITAIETAESEETSSLTFTWEAALGAGYYELYRLNEETGQWVTAARVNAPETSCTVKGLKIGESYQFKLASRAVGKKDGQVYYCSTWSNIISGTVEHLWVEDTEKSVAPGCETAGLTVHDCSICQKHEEIEVPATGHKVEEWETTKEPTRSEEGERQGTCTVCGETMTESIEKLPPVQTGSGANTNPGNKTETSTNPDGSKTTTTTKPDGSKTETTTQTDGTVTEKNTGTDGVVTETTKKPDNTVTEKVTQADGSATEKTTTPEGVTGQVNTDSKGEVTSAEVVIPKEAEKQDVVTAPVEVPAAKSAEEAPEISVRTDSTESQKVEIPVTEFGPGTVAVVVHPDGTEEVVRDCVTGENGVVLNVEGDVTLKIVDKAETFTDVEDANHWASDAVEFVAARELFKGTGGSSFTPDGSMTRGMMVTVLYRLAYEPETIAEGFSDVPSGQWYSDAVAWAADNGVVNGYGDGTNTFGPEDNVSREQLVTILHRYAQKKGYATNVSGTLAGFADAKNVSGWASDAMSWAVSMGLVNGVDNTHLAPGSNATRAEVATILQRFCEKVIK